MLLSLKLFYVVIVFCAAIERNELLKMLRAFKTDKRRQRIMQSFAILYKRLLLSCVPSVNSSSIFEVDRQRFVA